MQISFNFVSKFVILMEGIMKQYHDVILEFRSCLLLGFAIVNYILYYCGLFFFIHVMEGLFLAAREKCNMHLSKLIESNHKDPA